MAILPPGIVCDKCNNYFSQNVEKPFLESEAVKILRFHQAIPSRKGRIPSVKAVIDPDLPATVCRPRSGPFSTVVDVSLTTYMHLMSTRSGKFLISFLGNDPEDFVVSRFLAKVAVEAMAMRLMKYDGGIEYLISESQFDPIRRFAREGFPRHWPHFARRIYDPYRKIDAENGRPLQTVWEYDFLQTEHDEWYFVLALFGLELTINIGGAEVDGYKLWLQQNLGASPLYPGQNLPPFTEI